MFEAIFQWLCQMCLETNAYWKLDLNVIEILERQTFNIVTTIFNPQCDLAERQVDQMEIETFYKDNDFIGWTETSAKEGLMVSDAMRYDFLSTSSPAKTVSQPILMTAR